MEYMNDHTNGCSTIKDIFLAVTMGLMPGYGRMSKYGVNLEVSPSSDPEDCWELGGEYIYDDWGTAPIKYMSSSSALDTDQLILVQGLDIDGYEVKQIVTSNGQTAVELETPLYRAYRMKNVSQAGNNVNGVMTVHLEANPSSGVPAESNTRALINGAKNTTLMSLYTVPKGKVGFLIKGEVGVQLDGNAAALAEYAHIHFNSRQLGGVFSVVKAITCLVGGAATYKDERTFPDPIPPLTDLKVVIDEVSQSMGVWSSFDILLVDEEYVVPEALEIIPQP